MTYTYDNITKELRTQKKSIKKQLQSSIQKKNPLKSDMPLVKWIKLFIKNLKKSMKLIKANYSQKLKIQHLVVRALMAIDKALTLSESHDKNWVDGDLKQRQKLQNLVFPSRLGYDKSNDRVRTPKVIAIFGSILILTREISNIKNGEPIPVNQFSGLVTSAGFKPATS